MLSYFFSTIIDYVYFYSNFTSCSHLQQQTPDSECLRSLNENRNAHKRPVCPGVCHAGSSDARILL